MRNHIDQNLRCGADRLPLLLRLIDQRFGFSIKALCLFDDRSCSIEKIEQSLARWQGLLNLFKLCVAETGNVADELNEPVFHHGLTSPARAGRTLPAVSDRDLFLFVDPSRPAPGSGPVGRGEGRPAE